MMAFHCLRHSFEVGVVFLQSKEVALLHHFSFVVRLWCVVPALVFGDLAALLDDGLDATVGSESGSGFSPFSGSLQCTPSDGERR